MVADDPGALAAGRDLPSPRVGGAGTVRSRRRRRGRSILDEAGFTGIDLADVEEPVQLGVDAERRLRHSSRTLASPRECCNGLDERAKERALDELRATLAANETGDGVLLGSARMADHRRNHSDLYYAEA